MCAYQLFYNCFMSIKANGFRINNTSDLKTLSNLVSQYKSDLIEPVFASTNSGFVYNDTMQNTYVDTFDHESIGMAPIPEEEPEYVQLTLNIKDDK